MDDEVSLAYVANDLAIPDQGMMIAIPEHEWDVFCTMRTAEMVALWRVLAQKVRLSALRQSPRGPKKPRPKHEERPKRSPGSMATLLLSRNAHPVAP